MAIDIDDLSIVALSILDCVKIKEQKESFYAIEAKLNELIQIKFEGNAEIQNNYIQNIGRLQRAQDKMRMKLLEYDPDIQPAWTKLADKLNSRIQLIKMKKRIHARNQ